MGELVHPAVRHELELLSEGVGQPPSYLIHIKSALHTLQGVLT
jgi:hypothetical protein